MITNPEALQITRSEAEAFIKELKQYVRDVLPLLRTKGEKHDQNHIQEALETAHRQGYEKERVV